MSIKLAIHNRPGCFPDRWIKYCDEQGVTYKIVNCLDTNIIEQLQNVDGLLWHWEYFEPGCQLVARQIITSIENLGVKTFPNIATCWHYDDKVGQKYLLESIGAPLVKTYVFFNEQEAMNFINRTEFPKVFKLRSGGGSQNVKLVKTKNEAEKLCNQAFSKGFPAISGYFGDTRHNIRKIMSMGQFMEKLWRMPREIRNRLRKQNLLSRQIGYLYFQDFLPDNKFDTRITVIGNRAFGFTRNTRPNDFRASGSGYVVYDIKRVDLRCVQLAFTIAKKLGLQSAAFDFLFDERNEPKIGEISYCYVSKAVYDCPGHWDDKLNWHQGHVWPEDAILQDLLSEIFKTIK